VRDAYDLAARICRRAGRGIGARGRVLDLPFGAASSSHVCCGGPVPYCPALARAAPAPAAGAPVRRSCGHSAERIRATAASSARRLREAIERSARSFLARERAAEWPGTAGAPRIFLFLQGSAVTFFRRIAAGWPRAAAGRRHQLMHGRSAVLGGRKAVNYRGSLADWPAFIDAFLMAGRRDDLVLLGEPAPLPPGGHRRGAGARIRVTVTDFGYLRPDWITL